jgi:hypothetical protein
VIKRLILVGASGARSRPLRRSYASVDVLLHKSCDVLPAIGCGYAVGLQGECHFASYAMVGVGASSAAGPRGATAGFLAYVGPLGSSGRAALDALALHKMP